MILIGSKALINHFPDYSKIPKDIDYVTDQKDHGIISENSEVFVISSELYKLFKENSDNSSILTPNGLYTLKVSHVLWKGKNGKWWKHMIDISFMKSKGCKLIPEFHESLLKMWEERLGSKSHISFNTEPKYFFKETITRVHSHDYLHEKFKLTDIPMYKRFLKYENKALCSKEKFESLRHHWKIYSALEEIYVLSFERGVRFSEMYCRLITEMSKGYWNTFLIENVSDIMDGYTEEKKILDKIKESL